MQHDPLFPSPPLAEPSAADEHAETKAFARSMRKKMIGAMLIAAVSTGAAFMSCAGQGIAYKQMRAIESIAQRCGK